MLCRVGQEHRSRLEASGASDGEGNAEIAGLDNEGLDIDGLDNGRLDVDGLDIAGLDNDGRMCGQLTERKLPNFIP